MFGAFFPGASRKAAPSKDQHRLPDPKAYDLQTKSAAQSKPAVAHKDKFVEAQVSSKQSKQKADPPAQEPPLAIRPPRRSFSEFNRVDSDPRFKILDDLE